jgi:hypothetical protein
MTFSGTLIDDLMATVESAETRAQGFNVTEMEPSLLEPWLASVQENTDYDSKFLGVA